jgi:AAA family ATP:ADP antiporter
MTISQTPEAAGFAGRLASLFGIRTGESRPVALMVTLYFLVAASFVIVESTGLGLFIDEFGSRALPYAYLSVAILSSLVGYLYLKFSERVSFSTAELANLGFLALVCIVFWIGLRSALARWFVFLLPFWLRTLVGMANLVVWHVAGHVFNVRQAKRLFGLVGTGHWIANILGGVVLVTVAHAQRLKDRGRIDFAVPAPVRPHDLRIYAALVDRIQFRRQHLL